MRSVLRRLEVSVGCVTVRVLKSGTTPPLLFRVQHIALTKVQTQPSKEDPPTAGALNLLANKVVEVGECSLHVLKRDTLDPLEHATSHTHAQLSDLVFPQTYPLANHPSTVLLLKRPASPSRATFSSSAGGDYLLAQAELGSLEVILSMPQLEALCKFSELR